MKQFSKIAVLNLMGLVLLLGCAGTEETQTTDYGGGIDFGGEPRRITVQHVLIAFRGSVPGKSVRRTQQEAEQLAKEVYEKAKAGENFDALVRKYTDDSPPGIYDMVNHGERGGGEVYERGSMVPVFGDVGFKLKVGEIGLGEYDPVASKYGWHIIKRLK